MLRLEKGEAMTVTIEDVFDEENFKEAIESFADKRDTCGIDGVKLSELESYWNANGIKIKQSILDGTYTMGTIEQREIINHKGKRRTISMMNSVDRLIYRALYQKLAVAWESLFSDFAFAYRNNKGIVNAAEMAASYLEKGKNWSVEIDVHNFFDNIDHDLMLDKIRRMIPNGL